MLFLLFYVKKSLYALDSAGIVEVIPRINLRAIPHAPDYVAGVFDYHGRIVPVIDVGGLMTGEACSDSLGTRIILVRYAPDGMEKGILGLIAEGVTETLKTDAPVTLSSGIRLKDAPYLGDIVRNGEEMIQILDVLKILPDQLKEMLFADKNE